MQMNNQAINWGLLRFDKFTISFCRVMRLNDFVSIFI